jgi:hypothetical protein
MRGRRNAVKKKGRRTDGTIPCVSQRAAAVARMRNGVLLFDLKPGTRKWRWSINCEMSHEHRVFLVWFHQCGAANHGRSRLSAGWTRWKAGPRPERLPPYSSLMSCWAAISSGSHTGAKGGE